MYDFGDFQPRISRLSGRVELVGGFLKCFLNEQHADEKRVKNLLKG